MSHTEIIIALCVVFLLAFGIHECSKTQQKYYACNNASDVEACIEEVNQAELSECREYARQLREGYQELERNYQELERNPPDILLDPNVHCRDLRNPERSACRIRVLEANIQIRARQDLCSTSIPGALNSVEDINYTQDDSELHELMRETCEGRSGVSYGSCAERVIREYRSNQ